MRRKASVVADGRKTLKYLTASKWSSACNTLILKFTRVKYDCLYVYLCNYIKPITVDFYSV